MKIKKALFPFSDHRDSLKAKWWHRLFVVVFAFLIFIGTLSVIAGTIAGGGVGYYKINSKILSNLNEFTAKQDTSISDTVSLFTEQYSQIGCLEDSGKISYVSSYTLENKAYCSADLSAHLPSVADRIIREQNPSAVYNTSQYQSDKNGLIQALNQRLSEDTEKRYCFVNKDIVCSSSSNIVAYKPNILFYLQGLIISAVGLYLFSLFAQLLYFKGLIYIIYGNRRGNHESIGDDSK